MASAVFDVVTLEVGQRVAQVLEIDQPAVDGRAYGEAHAHPG
ncbi:hypothetical protein [Polaromonas jejuensis]|uniref:Uncharacterized protein n=1 Tax=Polaromonas jejuensis TaxID=457502 RepID=A0ABW0Q647_9BURK